MDHREELLRLFGMGPGDIEANRRGVLAEPQARRLARSGTMNLLASFVLGIALAAILYFVAERPLAPVQWIVASVLFVAALITGIVHFRKTRTAVAERRVECITGPVRTRMQGKAGWYLHVGDRTFRLPVRPWHVKSDARYRVYVAPAANRIVAMEPDA